MRVRSRPRGGAAEPAPPPAVDVRAVSVAYGGHRALEGVSLRVPRGAWVTLLGPNGAGKSTLLHALIDAVDFDGEILVDATPVRAMRTRTRAQQIAFVPQRPTIPPEISVSDYVLLGRTPHLPYLGWEGRGDRRSCQAVLERLDLTGFSRRPLGALSGGELQRVVLARALAQEAGVLLLDEPTTALDVGHQQQVLELVDTLRRERDLTVLSAMHDLTLAGQFGDRLVMLDQGRVIADGSAAQVLTADRIARHYHATVRVLTEPDGTVLVLGARPPRSLRGPDGTIVPERDRASGTLPPRHPHG